MSVANNRTREREWALKGAGARLIEMDQEREAILRAFPELRRAGGREIAVVPVRRTRPKLTAAAKRKLSAGMRKYWAKRKAQAAAGRS
jgi:hypothetical protein